MRKSLIRLVLFGSMFLSPALDVGCRRHHHHKKKEICPPSPAIPAQFIRGDANNDSKVDIADSIYILNHLNQGAYSQTFAGNYEFACQDAADVNDDGRIDQNDALYLSRALFLGTGEWPIPMPSLKYGKEDPREQLGVDPTEDNLTCKEYVLSLP